MIPEAAVEAAAEWLPHSGDCEVRPERDCTCWQSRVNLMRAALEAAAPFIAAKALEDAADEADTRSDTLLKTMQNMADSREYELADIVRYGAFSAEAKSAANRLRTRAESIRSTP